jgi:hypothetical protein
VVHLANSGTIIFPSDALGMQKNFEEPPVLPVGIYDSLGFYRTVEKVRKLQRRYDAKLIHPHDPEQFNTLKTSPAYYD